MTLSELSLELLQLPLLELYGLLLLLLLLLIHGFAVKIAWKLLNQIKWIVQKDEKIESKNDVMYRAEESMCKMRKDFRVLTDTHLFLFSSPRSRMVYCLLNVLTMRG